MGKITALKNGKRNPNRVNVYIDGKYEFSLEKIIALTLRIGQEISQEDFSRLAQKDAYEHAYQRVLQLFNRRPRTEKEIRDYLAKFELSDEQKDTMIQRLIELRMVNDEKYAQMWVESRNLFRPKSKSHLKMELRRKGIDDEAIADAIEDTDDRDTAMRLAQKKARTLSSRNLEPLEFKKKMYNYLISRGFSYDIVSGIVDELLSDNS